MAKVKGVKEAVKSAVEYIESEKIKEINGLIIKIKEGEYKDVTSALRGILRNQIEILELIKK